MNYCWLGAQEIFIEIWIDMQHFCTGKWNIVRKLAAVFSELHGKYLNFGSIRCFIDKNREVYATEWRNGSAKLQYAFYFVGSRGLFT